MRFSTIELHEPAKADVLAWPGEAPVAREAFAIVMDRADGGVHEAVVSLDAGAVVDWRALEGVQPRIMAEEFVECEEMLKRDPEYLAALAKRGITDPDLLMVDPWSAGGRARDRHAAVPRAGLGALRARRQRLRPARRGADRDRGPAGWRSSASRTTAVTPIPRRPATTRPSTSAPLRDDLRPIEITQPEGASFTVDGHEIRWQKWHIRIGFTAREGLVLHTVAYEDGDCVRPVIYRASFSEMVVPYGEVAPTHVWKNAFDIGEYGIGALANSLELGCDCLGEIRYFDGVLCDAAGEPTVLKNAVCLHEEDASLLWKHVDWRTGETEVRRSRRLVISFVATVGNYEYGYYWYFQQDGTIEWRSS